MHSPEYDDTSSSHAYYLELQRQYDFLVAERDAGSGDGFTGSADLERTGTQPATADKSVEYSPDSHYTICKRCGGKSPDLNPENIVHQDSCGLHKGATITDLVDLVDKLRDCTCENNGDYCPACLKRLYPEDAE